MDAMAAREIVMPGDRLGVEEEFAAADNTYVDESDGSIRSSVAGFVQISEGKISVHNPGRDIRIMHRGMLVLGTVTDDVKAVMFVKLDRIRTGSGEYLALKDGKIVLQKRRPERPGGFRGGDRGRGREHEHGGDRRDRHDDDMSPGQGERMEGAQQEESKPCSVGDVILAKIFYEDPEIYTLSLSGGPETGVVHSECELCGSAVEVRGGTLVCAACGHSVSRKVSSLYGQAEAIKRLFG